MTGIVLLMVFIGLAALVSLLALASGEKVPGSEKLRKGSRDDRPVTP